MFGHVETYGVGDHRGYLNSLADRIESTINEGSIRQVLALTDDVAPDSPINANISPSTWSSSPLFDVEWEDPPDVTGIAEAYVKLENPPSNADDFDEVFLTPGGSITVDLGVLLPVGRTPIYLWLEDGAGNSDWTTAVMVEAD